MQVLGWSKLDVIERSYFDKEELKLEAFDSSEIERLELHYHQPEETRKEFKLFIDYEFRKYPINLDRIFEDFYGHFAQADNCKILLSAPFGQGKTTFLNLFFEDNKDRYEVFKLYPVNYSISHNEDIFKFIKGEILFQLLGKDLEFDKIKTFYSLEAFNFIKEDPIRLIAPLIDIFSKIEKTAATVAPSLFKLATDFLSYKKGKENDDVKSAHAFLKSLYEQEGSIFEDNFYTQLIRQLISQLRQNTGKEIVLLIDDTDRIDPEHIFRIFNVFAAHFDTSEYIQGYSNKLGFDKIILVGDIENLKSIYAHKYGAKTNFNGYINKYYSKEPFIYDNNASISYLVEEIANLWPEAEEDYQLGLFKIIVRELALTGNLTLRELIKLSKQNPKEIITSNYIHKVPQLEVLTNSILAPFPKIIFFICKIMDIDSLIERVKDCKTKIQPQGRIQYDYYTTLGFATFLKKSLHVKDTVSHVLNSKNYEIEFVVKESHLGYFYYQPVSTKVLPTNVEYSGFNIHDFYEILLHNLLRYKEIGGVKPSYGLESFEDNDRNILNQ
ncbi:MAG: hypothetical protein IT236_05685 [Bacteroidia bacterium]|nr:hypothetical protein [Bacteroidia bacterium]